MDSIHTVDTVHKAVGSIAGAEVVNNLPDFQYSEIVKVLIQVIIGVCTIISFFRKPKQQDQ